ncbi:uncharacterized protein [Lepisosteus oculatus]|uniref:uncharacterized protein n=1 Tax=Lepisosteus oculatus TaxID=7918 RepID=UPI0035F501BB
MGNRTRISSEDPAEVSHPPLSPAVNQAEREAVLHPGDVQPDKSGFRPLDITRFLLSQTAALTRPRPPPTHGIQRGSELKKTFLSAGGQPPHYAEVVQVCAGHNETVRCDLSSLEVTWYRHKPGQSPQAILIYSKNSALPPSYYNGFLRTKFKASSEGGSHILVIVNVTEDDTATYYCSKECGKVEIGNGSLVTLIGQSNITQKDHNCSCTSVKDLFVESCIYGLIGSSLITAVCSGVGVFCCVKKRKDNFPHQTKTECEEKGASMDDVQYAALELSAKPSQKKQNNRKKRVKDMDVIYSDISHSQPHRSRMEA